MSRLFGTDGVRGIANTELTAELAYNLGRAGAYVLTEGTHKPKILVAKDTRISGDMLEAALVARYGGEEFCVLLKGASKYSSINYAKRIKENLDNLNIKHKYSKTSDHVTFSIGIYTTYTKNDLKNAIKFSDKALYISKTRGRNTYTYLEDNSSDSSN